MTAYNDLVSGNDLLSTLELPEEQNDANGEPEKKDLGWLYWLIGMGICAFIIFLLLKAFL